jgi:hypothetical protein
LSRSGIASVPLIAPTMGCIASPDHHASIDPAEIDFDDARNMPLAASR